MALVQVDSKDLSQMEARLRDQERMIDKLVSQTQTHKAEIIRLTRKIAQLSTAVDEARHILRR